MHKRGKRNLLFCVLILSLDVLPVQQLAKSQKYDRSKRVTKILKTVDGNCKVLEDNFQNDDGISNELLSTISVTGNFGTGKSFLLNFILAYLKQGDDAFQNTSIYEKAFSIEKNISSETTGIDMYNEYLPHPKAKGLVALVDTEGFSDAKKSQMHASTVFAVSAYFSSVLIYNVKEKFTTTNIDQIQVFLWDMRETKQGKQKYFQDLIIVFHDFPDPSFGFGVEGGKKYKQYMYGGDFEDDNLETFFRELHDSFRSLHLYLMPRPGNEVANRRSPMKTVGDMKDRKFVESVEELVKWTVNDLLVPRKFSTNQNLKVGNFMTELINFPFEKVSGSQGKTFAKFLVMKDIEDAMNQCIQDYQEELSKQSGALMSQADRQNVHNGFKRNAIGQFVKKTKELYAENGLVDEAKKCLEMLIDERFKAFDDSAMDKQYNVLMEKNIEEVMNQSIQDYQEELSKQWGVLMSQASRQNVHNGLKRNAFGQFVKKTNELYAEKGLVDEAKKRLEMLIDELFKAFDDSAMDKQYNALWTIGKEIIVGGAVYFKVFDGVIKVFKDKEQ